METTPPQDQTPQDPQPETAPQHAASSSEPATRSSSPQPADYNAYPLASPGKRLVAVIIDSIILMVMSIVVGFGMNVLGLDLFGSLLGFAVYVAYLMYFWTSTGATPGKSAMNIKIVDTDGNVPGAGQAILRIVGYWISSLVLFLGYIWILIDTNNQGWHDKIARTYVVDISSDK